MRQSLVKHHVPKVIITIGKSSITLPSGLEEGIRRLRDDNSRHSYKKLIGLFDEYGFYVPTRFVVGGQMIFEDTSTYTTREEAEKNALTLASEISAGYGPISGGGGFGLALFGRVARVLQ